MARSDLPRSPIGLVRSHPLASVAVLGVAAGVVAAVLLVLQPQKLFIDERVNEALPAAAEDQTEEGGQPAAGDNMEEDPATLASGAFRGLAHEGSGQAKLVRLADGSTVLRFEDLAVENGPDLKVYLSEAAASAKPETLAESYLNLGKLKGNQGNQNYTVPEGTDLERYKSAVIWCERFSVGFAVAPLA